MNILKKSMKHIFTWVMVLALCASIFPATVFAVDPNCATCGGAGKVETAGKCDTCFGYGSWGQPDFATGGLVTVICPSCNGSGHAMENCPDCGGISPDECTHPTEKQDWRFTTEPTCKESGVQEIFCATCGLVLETKTVRPTYRHEYNKVEIISEPTCTEEGGQRWVCNGCGTAKSGPVEKIPAIGHKWVKDLEAEQVEGKIAEKCETCGETQLVDCTHESTHTETVAATCTSSGTVSTICDTCRQVIGTDFLVPVDHDWDNGIRGINTPVVTYTCRTCGKTDSYDISLPGESNQPNKPYDREVQFAWSFKKSETEYFTFDEIPEDFAMTYTYEWKGEIFEATLTKKDFAEIADPNNGHPVLSAVVKVPVDPTAGDVHKGTVLTIKGSNLDIDNYEWASAYGYNHETGTLYVPANNTQISWIYNEYAKTTNYTINFYYDGVLGSTSTNRARVGATVTVGAGNVSYNGRTYEFSRVTGNTTLIDGENVINVYYTTPVAPPVEEEEEPTTPEPVIIVDEPTPLAELPEDDLVDIFDENVPLADGPDTGSHNAVWYLVAIFSMAGFAGLSIWERKMSRS